MYDSLQEAVNGFSKNVIEFFGGSRILLLLYTLLTGIGFWAVLVSMPLLTFLIYVLVLASMKVISSTLSRQYWLPNLLLFPGQQMVFVYIVAVSLYHRFIGKFTWKGRLVHRVKK
jgi:hypothetical protein